MDEKLICCRCQIPLIVAKTEFSYMGLSFDTALPRCPSCGQVFVSEQLATGRIAQVEMELEEK